MTSFIGRRRELAEAKKRLTESRLVTLTGPGGMGKTRLAIELTEQSARSFRDGVWFVELDGLEKEARVAPAVATTLSVPDQSNRSAAERVIDYVRGKALLIVLDNCEHVLQGTADLVSQLLAAAPQVRILATSREPLGIVGESVCVVPPLSTPSVDVTVDSAEIGLFESVQLFVDRARGTVADFQLTSDNRVTVAQLCARLDGMPLAIELATTRLRSLSAAQLLERLDQRFQLLNRGDRTVLPRQQTLEALISWSYELCTSAEQLLWRRLSIFAESFDLEAAEQICGFGDLSPADILDLLDQLVSKSVLSVERTNQKIRYHQLMTVRTYGSQLLSDAAERTELKRRHRDHYLEWTSRRAELWNGVEQAAFLEVTRAERPNLLASMEWSLSTPGEESAAARLGTALRYHWIAGGFLSDGRAWLDRALAMEQVTGPERGDALWVAGWVCLIQGDHEAAEVYLRECRDMAEELADPVLAAQARHWTALHHIFTGDLDSAITLYREVATAHEHAGDTSGRLTALFQLAMAQTYAGDHAGSLGTCEAAMTLAREQGERWNFAYALWVSGICHWHLGDYAAAEAAATEALEIQRDFQDGICTALTIELLSWLAASTDDFERARELNCAAGEVWRILGTTIAAFGPHIEETSRTSSENIRRALKLRRGTSGPEHTRDLTIGQAIDLALGVVVSGKAVVPKDHPLSDREMEVATLISEGHTNRLIAEKLFLSPRTIDRHVERLLEKLNFNSRTQVAAWVESMRSTADVSG